MSASLGSKSNPILIGVVGVTGSGKSSFIHRLTGNQDIRIGHTTESRRSPLTTFIHMIDLILCTETSKIEEYALQYRERHYVMIDSPGFNDSKKDDDEIFDNLANYLVSKYKAGRLLNGLLYLVSILDTRMKGSELRNLRMFKKLCGKENFKSIILGLTFCDREPAKDVRELRKKELISNPDWWGKMVKDGSTVVEIPYHLDRPEASLAILDRFAMLDKITLKLQEEVVHGGKKINDTEAASMVRHNQQLRTIREEGTKMYAEVKSRLESQRLALEEASRSRKAALQQDHELSRKALEERFAAVKVHREQALLEQVHLRHATRRDEEQKILELQRLTAQMASAKIEVNRLEERRQKAMEFKEHALKLRAFLSDMNASMSALNAWSQNGTVIHGNYGGHDMVGYFCNACLTPIFPSSGKAYGNFSDSNTPYTQ
jgi:GTP-binding protein EngB required for normal cell division